MRFFFDAMLPSQAAGILRSYGHDTTSPEQLGDPKMSDSVISEVSTATGYVIVTENWHAFARITSCPSLFVNKSWWPKESLIIKLASALDRWAGANPKPGLWLQWLDAEFR